jgi:hypothetical protein
MSEISLIDAVNNKGPGPTAGILPQSHGKPARHTAAPYGLPDPGRSPIPLDGDRMRLHAEIAFGDNRIVTQFAGLSLAHDASASQEVSAVGHGESLVRILLDQDDAEA